MTVSARALFVLSALAVTSQAHSALYTWNQTGGTHDWQNNANWSPATGFPNAAGDQADLTNDITAAQTIRVLTPKVTTGILNIGDANSTHNFSIMPNSPISTTAEQIDMDNNGVIAQINNLRGSNSIFANIVATGSNKDLSVDVASGSSLSIGDATQPTRSPTVGRFVKTGPGTVFMGGNATASSDPTVRIENGVIFAVGSNPLETNSVVTLVNNSNLRVGGGRTQYVSEVRGTGFLHDNGFGSFLRIGTLPETHSGTSFTSGGRTRPGDVTGDGGGAGGLGSGTGEVGRITVGDPSVTAFSPSIETGHELYFDITGPDTSGNWPNLYSANIDQINFSRADTTVNGGDIYINLTFQPLLYQKFRLFIDDHWSGFVDGTPLTPIFDNIYDNDAYGGFVASFADFVSDPEGGGFKTITFQYVPEPAGLALTCLVALGMPRRRRRARGSWHVVNLTDRSGR